MDFQEKTVLVTGAAGAIGKGIAAAFRKAGAEVFITDIDSAGLAAAAKEIDCPCLAADVTEGEAVAEVVSAAAKEFDGRIDILVNVAGIVGQGNVEDITEQDWDRMFAVNCKGTFLFIKNVVPKMKANKFGGLSTSRRNRARPARRL